MTDTTTTTTLGITNTTPQISIENSDYGYVGHTDILKVFGDELTYNELEPYTYCRHDTSHLEVKDETNYNCGFRVITVFIDKKKIMEKKYDVNWSCMMFYYLNELELEEEDDSEDDSEDDEEKMMCVVCGNEICIGWGHNPQPIKEDGVCCNRCNQMVVIPARLLEASMEK